MKTNKKIFLLSAIFVFLISGMYSCAYRKSLDFERITVSDKERVAGNGSARYLVFTDKETFEITDTFLFFKFNSSDQYGKIEKNKTYMVTTAGWRIPILSMYRNIISIKEDKD